jgi:hypothetical protein
VGGGHLLGESLGDLELGGNESFTYAIVPYAAPDPGPYVDCPIGETEEKYGVDILDSGGNVIRTIYATAITSTTYTLAWQIEDFGSAQSTYTIRVYQISPLYGAGTYREKIITMASL